VYKALALIRVRALTTASYRVQMILSIVSLIVGIVPLYFIAGALQPVMSDSIQAEGGHYFGFVLVGMVTLYFLTAAVNLLPGEFAGELRTGTLEAVLSTPARIIEVLVGMIGFGMLWTALRSAVVLVVGWALGVQIAWAHLPLAAVVIGLLILAYLPFGMIGSASIIAFRTAGPLAQGILFSSAMLGGVYYPTQVIPSWLQDLSGLMPLTYGLRALRQILLEGAAIEAVLPDLLILAIFALVFLACGTLALSLALRYARRAGTLAQY
jgi:ABC-2 type transport system permease protein